MRRGEDGQGGHGAGHGQGGHGAGEYGEERRRRRRRRRGREEEEAPEQDRRRRPMREDVEAPGVAQPGTGKLPGTRPKPHKRRSRPMAGMARRRRFDRAELEELIQWFSRIPEPLLGSLYRALGGQPGRVQEHDRIVQLTVKALMQGSRLAALLGQLHQRDRQALSALVQCGGLAQSEEFQKELVLMLGGREQDWARTMAALSDRGLVFASDTVEAGFYYLIPEPLMEHMATHLEGELALSTFAHDDIRVVDPRPFCPPMDFSLATLATWMLQKPPRLTQRHEVFKAHRDEMDKFFSQVWAPDSEMFALHYDFLMMHGMIALRGDRVSVDEDAIEEWLTLEPEDQRDLIFRALEKRFPLAEWVLWAVHAGKGEWIPEAPLQALYRRWRRGEDWRERYQKGQYVSPRGADREGYSFNPLVLCGMLELGVWGQQKFYRLTQRALRLVEPPADEGFTQFYLTPNYEIIAPAGLSPLLLFRIGELAELVGCDRANTYRITEVSVEQALRLGWRREELFDFLRDNSQTGLPENVERTLRGWVGQEGEVEFHDVTVLTVHRSLVRRLEAARGLKPWLLHRFGPGLYAVDRSKLAEITAELKSAGFVAAPEVRRYPADEESEEIRERLHLILAEARQDRDDPSKQTHGIDAPEELRPVPGSALATAQARREAPREPRPPRPHRQTPDEIRAMAERAIAERRLLQMEYLTKDQTPKEFTVAPERIALDREGALVLVATEVTLSRNLSFSLARIQKLKISQ